VKGESDTGALGDGQGWTMRVLAGLAGPLTLAVIVYGLAKWSASIFAVAVILSSAAFTFGALLGFLFGVPRTLTSEADAHGQDAATGAATGPGIRPNSNLEQISDWLTKILIGVGLVELTKLVHSIGKLRDSLAPSLGDDEVAKAFTLGLLIGYLFSGFLVGYIFTRLRLQSAFYLADSSAFQRAVTRVIQARGEADADAMGLVNRQLDPDAEPPTQEELDAACRGALQSIRVQAFDAARRQRRSSDPELIRRTIPVFRALIAADTKERYHRNYAELGYALKDAEPPDYAAAIDALTKAIQIRDARNLRGWRRYELNRALCRISVEGAGPSTAATREAILSDLRQARAQPNVAKLFDEDTEVKSTISAWLSKNHLSTADLEKPG
jgi:hypothetical protein